LSVALIFLAKHLQLPKLCATNLTTLVNRLRWLLFLPKTAQFAHSNIDGVVNAIGGQGSPGCLLHAGKGRHWPPPKIQLHLAMNPSMAAFEAVKAARTPQLWGRRWVRESFSPKNQNNTRKPLALAISPWRLEFVIFLYFEGMFYD
jgi:hypothetical protein